MANHRQMHAAAEAGDATTVRELLRERPVLARYVDSQGLGPLHKAATVEVARLLVEHGADVNANAYGTPLYYAVENNRLEVARLLIERGAAVNAARRSGETPLAFVRSRAMAQLLLEHGARLNGRGGGEWTPLFRAVDDRRTETVDVLVGLGADVNVFVPREGTPLIRALHRDDYRAARMMIEAGSAVNGVRDHDGYTPLHEAARLAPESRSGGLTRADLVRILVAGGVDLTARNERGETPLDAAAQLTPEIHGGDANDRSLTRADLVRMLIARGADLTARNERGETPLHVAQRFKAADIVEVLRAAMDLHPEPTPLRLGRPFSRLLRMHPAKPEGVTVLKDGGLARWGLAKEPRLLARVQTNFPDFDYLAVAPDGAEVAITSGDTLEVRRWEDLELVRRVTMSIGEGLADLTYPFMEGLAGTAYSPDRRWLAVIMDGWRVHLIDRASGETVQRIEGVGNAWWLSFDPASRLLACGGLSESPRGCRVAVFRLSEDGRAAECLWDDREPEDLDEEDDDAFWRPMWLAQSAISPDGRWLAYFGADEFPCIGELGQMAVHDLETGALQWHARVEGQHDGETVGTEVVFTGSSEFVCGFPHGTLLFYDAATGAVKRRLKIDTPAEVVSVALERGAATLWVVLGDGTLAAVRLGAE